MKIIWTFLLLLTFEYAYVGALDNEYIGFDSKSNEHGLVLTTTGVLYEVKGFGAGTEYIKKGFSNHKQGIVIYLGKSCDAYSRLYGNGSWAWANGGFEIVFKSKRIGFARQEVSMDHILRMDMSKCSM